MEQTKAVRVSYVPTGYGLALEIDDTGELALDEHDTSQHETKAHETKELGADDGLLRISDARITLELPAVDGKTSTLAWDPEEVPWEALLARS